MDYRERGTHARGVVYPTQDTSLLGTSKCDTKGRNRHKNNKKSGRKERGHEGVKVPNKTKLALRT